MAVIQFAYGKIKLTPEAEFSRALSYRVLISKSRVAKRGICKIIIEFRILICSACGGAKKDRRLFWHLLLSNL